jgi:protein SCO1/2
MGMKRVFFYFAVAVVVVAFGLVLKFVVAPLQPPPKSAKVAQVPAPPPVGGPFTMVNQHGQTVRDTDFQGRHMLIFFGYTYCPDICPTVLTNVTQALELLGPAAAKVQPIFVSVDPERDTPDQLKMYLDHFHPTMVGLTGSKQQVAAVKKAYRVYAAKADQSADDPDDYLMAHGSILYLMGTKGEFEAFFGHQSDPETMAHRIKEFL